MEEAFKTVKSSSFSLDKVTVESKPYTVLVTYFLNQGQIRVFLNNLHVMLSKEYDGEGTANCVGMELVRSADIFAASIFSLDLLCAKKLKNRWWI